MNISVFKKKGDARKNKPWCCRWVVYEDGKKKRKEAHFETKALADGKRAELLKSNRTGRTHYTDSQLAEIDHAWKLCMDAGIGLLDAVKDGLKGFVPGHGRGKAPTVDTAFEAYLADCVARNLRPDTVKGYRALLNQFVKSCDPGRKVDTLEAEELTAFIVGHYSDEQSRKNMRARLTGLWNYCAEPEQQWLPPLPRKAISWKSAEVDQLDPVIYTVDEARALLEALPDYLKCGAAVGLFAGVRPKELLRIRWSMQDGGGTYGIDFERRTIRLHASWTKKRRSRTLHDLPDNLWQWLERYRTSQPQNANADANERLVPIGEQRWYTQLRAALEEAGISKVQNGKPAKDVMRHSFGSYGRHRGLEWAVDTLGHDEGLAVFNKHYKESAASPADAEAYFGIAP